MADIPSEDNGGDSTVNPLPQDDQTPFNPADSTADNTQGFSVEDASAAAGTSADPTADGTDDVTGDQSQSAPPDPASTHPVTDTNVQPEEVYEAGLGDAAGAPQPSSPGAATGYNPPPNQQNGDAANQQESASDQEPTQSA